MYYALTLTSEHGLNMQQLLLSGETRQGKERKSLLKNWQVALKKKRKECQQMKQWSKNWKIFAPSFLKEDKKKVWTNVASHNDTGCYLLFGCLPTNCTFIAWRKCNLHTEKLKDQSETEPKSNFWISFSLLTIVVC